jgi:oxygen-independent coproporphyrinogen-3 oxidase
MLYLHIPFCPKLCYYCICSKQVTEDYSRVHDYVRNYLLKEVEMVGDVFRECGRDPKFTALYFGGGTPNYLNEADFDAILDKISKFVDFDKITQFTVESDPRRVDVDKLRFYHSRGVNKLSFGVQDFDPTVQQEINRISSPDLLHRLLIPEIREKFGSINFDILIGLPGQTPSTMRRTIEQVLELEPDRIQFAYCHYSPAHRKYMILLNRNRLIPDFYERKAIFAEGLETILDGGYIRTGFEHFAKPIDPDAQAFVKEEAIYNGFGPATGEYNGIIGLGSSGYSSIGEDYYFQNVYEQTLYRKSLNKGCLPVLRGYKLTPDDKLCRDVINRIRTYFRLSYQNIETKYGINFHERFSNQLILLEEFVRDGLVVINSDGLRLTPNGQHFSALIASVFDGYRKLPWYNAGIPIPGV